MNCTEWATRCRAEADRALAERDQSTARIVLNGLSYHERYCRNCAATR